MASPKGANSQYAKRKTVVVTQSGTKKVINTEDLQQLQQEESPSKVRARRNNKKEKISDVFGDFFGFGANPPGCMNKGAPKVDFKHEKERFIALIKEEAKSYDLDTIKIDLSKKIDQIAKGIKKEEKNIVVNEDRQLRNLDKLEYMSQYLKEDNQSTQISLTEAQQIRDQSKVEMQQYQLANTDELSDLAQQL